MRTAPFSSFRRLWRRLVRTPKSPYEDGLPSGKYELHINYSKLHLYKQLTGYYTL
jgi:hypothetical protein